MAKALRFAPNLVPLILSGEKTSTWRLWDDKDLQVGDQLEFTEGEERKRFSLAIITVMKEKRLGELTDDDMAGHERFDNMEELYKAYTRYCRRRVGSETPVKILHFKLVSHF